MRSSDWNAHAYDLPPPPEDPAPEDGNPHPLYGPYVTAEQVYQQQLQAWFQQNAAPGHHYGHQHGLHHQEIQHVVQVPLQQQQELGHQEMDVEMQGPPLFNFQTLLAEQGVPFYAGLPPARNNIADSPMQAWTDTGQSLLLLMHSSWMMRILNLLLLSTVVSWTSSSSVMPMLLL
jgi:hypothetical protein